LIIDVSDSKGKPCGRVVAQVATMAEDPVRLYEPFCCLLPKLFIKNGSCYYFSKKKKAPVRT